MIKEKQPQDSFFDLLWGNLIPKNHELVRIKEKFNFSWIDRELESFYSSSPVGRPPYPPRTIFLTLFLEVYANLSDHEVEEQLRYNALYRYFVGLPLEDSVPDYSTLSVFRERLGEEGFRRLFERFVEELEKAGLISHRLKIVDATHVLANARARSRLGIVRQAQGKLRAAMKRDSRETYEEMLTEDQKGGTPRMEQEGEENPTVLAEEIGRLREMLAKAQGEKFSEAVAELAKGIEELLFMTDRSVGSLTDADAAFGHKSKDKGFYGYKVHTVTNESEIVTTVETMPGNVHEGQDLPRLLAQEEERGLSGEVALADKLYGSGENREGIRKGLGMQEVIPADDVTVQAEAFCYDGVTQELRCPEGKVAIGSSPHPEGKLFYFSKDDCGRCHSATQCPSYSERQGRARVLLSLDRQLRLESPLSPDLQKALFRFRTTVERIYGKAKKWHDFSTARYRGRWRVAIHAFLTFFMLNAKKALRIIEGRCPLRPQKLVALGYG